MKPLAKVALIRVIFVTSWACIGGVIFSAIEHVGDRREQKRRLLSSLNDSMSIKYNMTATEFEHFIKMAYEALRPEGPQWDIEDGIDFAFQTITTIGYGNITPVTQLGQGLCILFGIVGIPLTLLALKSVGELIKEGLLNLIRKFETRLLKREEVSHCEAKCALASLLITIAMLCLGAALSMRIRNLSFLEGFYFWFISFTTVGFGDYAPGQTKDRFDGSEDTAKRTTMTVLSKFLTTVWYILGLCMVSSVITSIQCALEVNRCHNCPGFFSRRRRAIEECNGGVTREDNVIALRAMPSLDESI